MHGITAPPPLSFPAVPPFCQCLAKSGHFCRTLANPSAARGKHFAKPWQNWRKFAKHWQKAGGTV
jgi:hypothetical protein